MITASLNEYRQSPRKVRLLADMVRGKDVNKALVILGFATKRGAEPMKKLIESAIANATHNFSLDADKLFVKEIQVNKGVTLKRMMPGAQGRGFPIHKHTSHVTLSLAVRTPKLKGAKVAKVGEEKAEKAEKAAKTKAAAKAKKA